MVDNSEMCAVPVRFAESSIPGEALAVIRAADWPMVKDRLANVHARRPDGDVYVGWLPEDGGPWAWEVEHTRGENGPILWTAAFTAQVPTAAVAAFLGAVTGASGADGAACADVAAADALLRGAGWEVHDAGTPPWDGYGEGTTPWQVLARHGDGDLRLAFLDVVPDGPADLGPADAPSPRVWPAWALVCTAGPDGPAVWWAELSRDAPADAVAAFLAAVTPADLVNRRVDELSPPVRRRFA